MSDLTDFEQFLMLDDVKGNFKEQADAMLADIQSKKAQEAELFADDSADNDEPVYDDQFDSDFSSMFDSDDLIFEGEEGFTNKATNPNRADKEADQVDDDNFLAENEESDDQESPEGDDSDYSYADESESENEIHQEALPVNFEDYVTLPDGRELQLKELADAYVSREERLQFQQELEAERERSELREKGLDDLLAVANLDVDQQLAYYNSRVDWDELAVVDPQSYVTEMRHYQGLQERKNQLLESFRKREAAIKAQEHQEFIKNAQAANKMLQAEFPQWNEAYYQEIMQHGINLGWAEDDIIKEIRVPVFKALVKSYEAQKNEQKAQTLIKRSKPANVVKSGVANKQNSKAEVDQAKIAKAFSTGKLNHADAFKYLVD